MLDTKQIFSQEPGKLIKKIRFLRETKGREGEAKNLISQAFIVGHEFIVDLFWEESLLYQHKIMSEQAKKSPDKSCN